MSEPSMKDVATRARVSVGTVSNVLNRPELVSDATRRRVLTAIGELGFVRNDSARRLRGAHSRTLAYVMLDAANPFFTDVARGVRDAAEPAGLTVFLCDSGQDPAREAAYLNLLEEQRVEGVLITPVDVAGERLDLLPRRGTPVVLVDRAGGPDRCSVAVDDVLGGELAATHLLDTGHRRLGFVGGPMRLSQISDRLSGVRRALAQLGDRPGDAPNLAVLETTALDVAEGRRAGERLAGLPAARRPTGVVCGNDLVALGLLQQAVRLRLRVPDDLAIIGYDDIEFAEAAAVPLTSVAQPRHLLGRTAVEMLLDEARHAEHTHRQIVFAPELVVRTSTGVRPLDGVA